MIYLLRMSFIIKLPLPPLERNRKRLNNVHLAQSLSITLLMFCIKLIMKAYEPFLEHSLNRTGDKLTAHRHIVGREMS